MIYLALGAAALWFILAASRSRPVFKRREWRLLSAAFAIAAFAGAAFVAMREAWVPAVVLVVLGLWLAVSARQTTAAPQAPRGGRMSLGEARAMLGVTEAASPAEIELAYKRLMRLAHPDKGGTSGLAAQLNAARDRLLRG